MAEYLSDKKNINYELPDTLISARYCKDTGLLASSSCSNTDIGYYAKDNLPSYCSETAHNTEPTSSENENKTDNTEERTAEGHNSNTEPITARPTNPTTEPPSFSEDHTSPTSPSSSDAGHT